MGPLGFLFVVHGMAGIALFLYALRYQFGMSSAWKWGAAGLVGGMAPLGVFAWITRDDWGFMNKLVGFCITLAFEFGVLAVALGELA